MLSWGRLAVLPCDPRMLHAVMVDTGGFSASTALFEAASLAIVPALIWAFPPAAPETEIIPAFVLLGVIPLCFFYLCSFCFWALDTCASARWRAGAKMQGVKGLVATGSYGRAFVVSLESWFLVGLPWAWFMSAVLGPARGCPMPSAPWSPLEFAVQLPLVRRCFLFFCSPSLSLTSSLSLTQSLSP